MTPADSIALASLVEIRDALRRRRVSSIELADLYRERQRQNARLKAFISPPDDKTRRDARRIEQRLMDREDSPLLGVPIAIKDLFATRSLRTTAGSRILRDWVPTKDAAVVSRLRGAGALVFGKTNLHEFAYGVTNANPWWGIARNPHDEERSPGGSSGGSAIAVASGLAAAALGSDTGGSIRIPAALCGCVGLKPTYGTIPLDGAVPLGWSLDHAGPMTRSVDDAGLLFDVLSGSTVWHKARGRGGASRAGVRLGLLGGGILENVMPSISRTAETAAQRLGRHGLRIRRVTIPELDWTVATQLVTLRAEATAVHHRWLRVRPASYGRDTRVRLQLGALVSAADYVLAQRMRGRIREALRRTFEDVDLLLLPTTPIVAPVIGARTVRWADREEPVDGALVRLTAPFNLTGLPALSIPAGDDNGLPIGLQLVAPWNEEVRLLTVGRLVEEISR